MMLVVLRILFGAGLAFGFIKVCLNARTASDTGDLTNAFYLGVCVLLAVANAAVWAPFVGDAISRPLTSVFTKSTYVDRRNLLLAVIHRLENHRLPRLTALVCFLEAIRHPRQPAAFVIGLKNARPGSWLEKVYALEVFKFSNARNCALAYRALRRRGIDPRPHFDPEVNMALASLEREVGPAPEAIALPPAPPAPPLKRDPRIKLFDTDEHGTAGAASDSGQDGDRVSPMPRSTE
jgi:hypothetical protein